MSQGLTVMIIGMATVFAFLVLLIFSIKGASLYFVKNAHNLSFSYRLSQSCSSSQLSKPPLDISSSHSPISIKSTSSPRASKHGFASTLVLVFGVGSHAHTGTPFGEPTSASSKTASAPSHKGIPFHEEMDRGRFPEPIDSEESTSISNILPNQGQFSRRQAV